MKLIGHVKLQGDGHHIVVLVERSMQNLSI